MTRRLGALALAGVTVAALSGCSAVNAVVGVHAAPAAVTTGAPVTAQQARTIASRVFTVAAQSETPEPSAVADRAQAYAGPALLAAQARAHLAIRGGPAAPPASPALTPEQPGLLAVSRGDGFPRALVAQTLPVEGGLPVLHLLLSTGIASPYRIGSSATMLPDSAVPRLDSLRDGSPVGVPKDLAVQPAQLLADYARSLSYPAVTVPNPGFGEDRRAYEIRQNAAAQAAAVATQASFTQSHKVLPEATLALQQAAGGALVFGVIERTDTFTVKPGQTLAAPPQFVAFAPRHARITRSATMTTLEFVVFTVPKQTGSATLVAASEQLVAAKGS